MTNFKRVDDQKPYAQIEQISRRRWRICIGTGNGLVYGAYDGYGWTRHSRAAAERKGEKELSRYLAKFGDLAEAVYIQ